MENINITDKKKWDKDALYGLVALVSAFVVPWAYLALSDAVLEHYLPLMRWYMGGIRFEPYGTLSFVFSGNEWVLAALAIGLLGLAVYFSWRAINRTRERAERGWSLSVLTFALSIFTFLLFISTIFDWFRIG